MVIVAGILLGCSRHTSGSLIGLIQFYIDTGTALTFLILNVRAHIFRRFSPAPETCESGLFRSDVYVYEGTPPSLDAEHNHLD